MHPAESAAAALGETLLRPNAEKVDVAGVPRSHLDALAAAGLMDVVSLPASVQRQVAEELAAADASTWFVWTQHHTPVRKSDLAQECGHELTHIHIDRLLASRNL